MEKIRFGIVGIGMMGRMHATSLQRNPHAEVVAVCARTESKVKAFQEEFGVPYGYTNVDELVNNPEVDAIVVATGADAHKAPCLAACKAKKHIFCEKPLAKTLEDCEEIEKAVAENGSKCFTVGFMRRFDPSYAEAKEKIRAGAIGKPILFKGVSLDPSSVLEAHLEGVKKGIYVPWFIRDGQPRHRPCTLVPRGRSGRFLCNRRCYVCTGLADYNDYDNGFSLTKFDNNTTAYIQVGRTATCSHVESEIVGTKGTLRVNSVPRKNYLSQFTENGFVEECQESFLARWGRGVPG
mgnify:CR=1 FL=1